MIDAPPSAEATTATDAARSRGWRVAALVAVAVCTVVNVVVAWSARWPSFPYDEVATFQMSRLLVGQEVPEAIGGAGYFPGWSLLMAPLWWVTDDPLTVYRLAIVGGVVMALVTIWPLSLVLRRWGLGSAQGVVAAAVVMTLPVRALQSDYALSEKMVFAAVVLLTLAVMRLWERPGLLRVAVVAALAFVAFFTHVRMLPLLLALLIWLVLFLRRDWRIALIGVALVGAAIYGADELGRTANEVLLGRELTQGENFGDKLAAMRPSLPIRTALGQSWSQLLASFGVIAIGVVSIVVAVWKDVRRARFGPTVFVFGGALAMFLTSVLNWASDVDLFGTDWIRLDLWLYSRYMDPVTALVIASGVVALIKGVSRARFVWSMALVGAVCLPVLLWIAPQAPTFGYVTPAHMPGIIPWAGLLPTEPWPFPDGPRMLPSLTNENRFWLVATLTVLAVLAVLALLRRRGLASALVLLAVAAPASLVGNVGSDRFQATNGTVPTAMLETLDDLEAARPDLEVVLITECPDPLRDPYSFRNFLFYYALPDMLVSAPNLAAAPGADVAVGCDVWSEGLSSGALMLPETRRGVEVLWLVSDEALEAAQEAGVVD